MTLVGIRAPRASKSSPGSTCWITSLPCATRQTFRNAPSQTFRNPHSESDLEEALIRHLESFLLELGGDFTFVGRQKRLRLDDVWFRVDLVLYHRRLRCLVIIDLKLDKFTHADVGQMNVYLNYAKRHWTHPGENPPVGLILCASKGEQVAEYALEGIANRMLAADYRTKLPDPKSLEIEMAKQREPT
jgi:hypothetical protein